jgi:iron complex outermembrane receptor protein
MNKKLVIGGLLASVSMFAIDAVIPAMAAVDEVVVTARKRAENLQDVPISISAFSEDQLAKAAIRDVKDLADFTSNMTFNSSEDGRLAIPTIRGMGMIDTRGFDNNVSVFLDGAFVSGRSAQNLGMLDLERVEVVKGPQSALYGRNSFAGAINYVTKKPGDEFEGKVEASYGEDDLYQIIGAVSGPIVEGKVAGRLAFDYDHDGGTYENIAPGGDGLGGHENKSVSGTLRFTPNDMSDIVLTAAYSEEDIDQLPLSFSPNNCGELDAGPSTPPYDVGVPYYQCGEVQGAGTDKLSFSPDAYSAQGDSFRFGLNMEFDVNDYTITSITSYTEQDSHGNMDLDRSDGGAGHYAYVTLADAIAGDSIAPGALVGGRMGYHPTAGPPIIFADVTNNPFTPLGPPPAPGSFPFPYVDAVINPFAADAYLSSQTLDQDYISQEVRIESNVEERFRWSAGAFYFKSESTTGTSFNVDVSAALEASGLDADELIFLTSYFTPFTPTWAGPPIGPPQGFYSGLFGSSHIPLPQPSLDGPNTARIWSDGGNPNNGLTASEAEVTQYALFGSVEYDFTDKLTGTAELRWTSDERTNVDLIDDFFFSLDTYVAAGQAAFNEVTDEYWDPRFILSYKVNDDALTYVSASHGTRSGGINPNLALGVDPFFEPEENWTYEVGAKTTWLDGALQINGAAFYVDWTDAQFRQIQSSGGGFLTTTQNSEGLEVKGIEIDAVYALNENILIAGGYGYSDAEFEDGTLWTGGNKFCDGSLLDTGSSIPYAPVNCVTSPVDGGLYPDMSGAMPKRTSKHTANVAVEYRHPMANDTEGFVRVDASYRSKQYVDEVNLGYVPGRTVMNLRTGIETDNYDLILWVENLLDDDNPTYAQQFGTDFNSLLTTSSAVNPALRRVGITGRYRF